MENAVPVEGPIRDVVFPVNDEDATFRTGEEESVEDGVESSIEQIVGIVLVPSVDEGHDDVIVVGSELTSTMNEEGLSLNPAEEGIPDDRTPIGDDASFGVDDIPLIPVEEMPCDINSDTTVDVATCGEDTQFKDVDDAPETSGEVDISGMAVDNVSVTA